MQNATLSGVNIFESILSLATSDKTGSKEYRQFELESLYNYCRDGMDRDSGKFLATLFINALNNRLFSSDKMENIYEKQYDVSQIQLFDILINKFPFVKYSQQIINEAIVAEIGKHERVTLIDIGIGLGTQMMNVLEKAKSLPNLKAITLVGIEPFTDALSQATARFNAVKADLPFELNYIPVAEYVEQADFASLCPSSQPVIVNASLALHHIQTSEKRNQVMDAIHSINPVAFFLIEPNVDHFEPDFEKRFHNCFGHFYAIFRLIDTLDITSNEKSALKLFFGREIEDILGKQEADRFEKHEPAVKFIDRLHGSGFITSPEHFTIPVSEVSGVSIRQHSEGFVGFTYDNETVLALICAR